MPTSNDLNSSISAAQREVDSWSQRAKLATQARPAGSRWRMILAMWGVLLLALFSQRHAIAEMIAPHASAETIDQLSAMMIHTADDIELYRKQFGALPDSVPIDFLHGVISYQPDGNGYVLDATYHYATLRLSGDANGAGQVEIISR